MYATAATNATLKSERSAWPERCHGRMVATQGRCRETGILGNVNELILWAQVSPWRACSNRAVCSAAVGIARCYSAKRCGCGKLAKLMANAEGQSSLCVRGTRECKESDRSERSAQGLLTTGRATTHTDAGYSQVLHNTAFECDVHGSTSNGHWRRQGAHQDPIMFAKLYLKASTPFQIMYSTISLLSHQ
jgi:hypothetical protein